MQDNILFYLVFLGQLILISYYLPSKMAARIRGVINNYPPSDYPKLYPQSTDVYLKGQVKFLRLNHMVLALGIVLLIADIYWSNTKGGGISEAFPAVFGMFQFLPMLLLELSEMGQFKLMRKDNTSTKRTAQLQRRKLFDHVSPMIVLGAVVALLTSIACDLYWSGGGETYVRMVTLIVANAIFAGIVSWHLLGKKINPHQSFEDRSSQIAMIGRAMSLLSIVMSLFFIVEAAENVYDLEAYEAVIVSVYFQLIAFISIGNAIWGLPLEDINFDVYKADA